MYRYAGKTWRRERLLLLSACVLTLVFMLSACGTNTTTGSPSGKTTSTPAPTPRPTQEQASANGCPNHTVVTTSPVAASVTLTNKNSDNTVSVNKGETIEVDLPFGQDWSGPANFSQDLLSMQSPAGYASPATRICVWRFVATKTGTAHLSFIGRPICKRGQLCPMYVLAVPFTIIVK